MTYPPPPSPGHQPVPPPPYGPPIAPPPPSRPGAATFAVAVLWLFAALCAWGVWVNIRGGMQMAEAFGKSFFATVATTGQLMYVGIPLVAYTVLLACAVATAPGIAKGRYGSRVFGIVWSSAALPLSVGLLGILLLDYTWSGLCTQGGCTHTLWEVPEAETYIAIGLARHIGLIAMVALVFVLMLVPPVRRWTAGRPTVAAVMVQPPYPPRY